MVPRIPLLFQGAETFVPPAYFAYDPVANDYDAFFNVLRFEVVPERDESKPWPGRLPHPERAYVKAQLVMIREKITYHTDLRDFLVKHPALVLHLGFRPVIDPTSPWGFDVERTVPCDRHLRRKLQYGDNGTLKAVLAGTVADLRDAVRGLGETISQDVKHIYAGVKENNPKAYVKERYDPQRQPRGDPDCKLGVKRRHNQGEEEQDERKEYLWGYGTGIVAAKIGQEVECVLAEHTQTFNENDVTYFQPLLDQTCANLGFHPTNLTADAAFDAWYVYEPFAQRGGLACVPLNQRGHPEPKLGPNGFHLCDDGHEMVGSYVYEDRTRGYPAQVGKSTADALSKRDSRTVRITHPTHPLRGQSFEIVPLFGGKPDPTQILIALPNGDRRLVPAAWTDQVAQIAYPPGACFLPERLVVLRQRLAHFLARVGEQAILTAPESKCEEPGDSHANHPADPVGAVEPRATGPDHRRSGRDASAPPGAASGGGA